MPRHANLSARRIASLRKIRCARFLHFLQFLQADGGWARPGTIRNRASALSST